MSSFFLAHERDQMFRRLERVQPDLKIANGIADGHDTVLHLSHDLDMILGDAPPNASGNLWQRSAGRWLVLNLTPWPERMPREATHVDAFTGSRPRSADFNADFADLVEKLRRFDARCRAGSLAPHPVYGTMDKSDWGKYLYLHTDWHLSTLQL